MKKYYPIYIAIGALILINVIFLWNEPFNPSLPFDATKFSTLVYIVGIVLNSLTIYLLYIQIGEMIEGRNETIISRISQLRPELFPQDLNLETEDYFYPNSFMETNPLPIPLFYQYQSGIRTKSSDIVIGNTGFGPAINLTIEWIFDESEVINYIGNRYNCNQNVQKIANTLFVTQNKYIQAKMPNLYLTLYGAQLNMNVLDRALGTAKDSIKPLLQLKLTYIGTFDESYEKLFNVNFNATDNRIYITFTKA